VLIWDHQGSSFIVVLDKNTGNEIWRAPREEIDTWSTPLVIERSSLNQRSEPGRLRASVTRNHHSARLLRAPVRPLVLVPVSAHSPPGG